MVYTLTSIHIKSFLKRGLEDQHKLDMEAFLDSLYASASSRKSNRKTVSTDEERGEHSSLLKKVDSSKSSQNNNYYVAGKRSKEILKILCICTGIFWIASIILYRVLTQWDLVLCVFYVVNVGFGVGYKDPHNTMPGIQWWTSLFVFISGGMVATIIAIIASLAINTTEVRVIAPTKKDSTESYWTGKRLVRIVFLSWFLIFWICFAFIEVHEFRPVRSLLFLSAAASGAGVEDPPNMDIGTLWLTIVFLIIGVPLNSVFWGTIADDALFYVVHRLTQHTEAAARPAHIVGRRYSTVARKSGQHRVVFMGFELDLLTTLNGIWCCTALIAVGSAAFCLHWNFYSWDFSLALFFTVNVMEGIGYSRPTIPTNLVGKLIVAIICFAGTFLLISGILLLNLTFQVYQQQSQKLSALVGYGSGAAYIACVLYGYFLASLSMAKRDSTSMLFSVSTMTSAGIVSVYDDAEIEVLSTIFIIFAVPTHIIFWSYWASLFVKNQEIREYFKCHPFTANRMRLWLKRARTEIARRNYEDFAVAISS